MKRKKLRIGIVLIMASLLLIPLTGPARADSFDVSVPDHVSDVIPDLPDEAEADMTVYSWDRDHRHFEISIEDVEDITVNITLDQLEENIPFDIYVDGEFFDSLETDEDGYLEFEFSDWSTHEFELTEDKTLFTIADRDFDLMDTLKYIVFPLAVLGLIFYILKD